MTTIALKFWQWRQRRKGGAYSWMGETFQQGHPLDWYGTTLSQSIVETKNGGVLKWIFHLDPVTNYEYALTLFLTHDEIEQLLDKRMEHVGLIEPVRSTLQHPHAILSVNQPGQRTLGLSTFIIPSTVPEQQFMDAAFDVAMRLVRDHTFRLNHGSHDNAGSLIDSIDHFAAPQFA